MSANLRAANLERLEREPFDLLVVGGGIIGAGVARDAALRGLRVALVEQSDFGAGTSGRSSKLIHGGFRYLASFQLRLVHESLQERGILLRRAPHLVHPQPVLLPYYRDGPYPPWMLKFGVSLYDALAGGSKIQSHMQLTPYRVIAFAPWIRRKDLVGGALYYDAITDDARLVLENVKSAWKAGAACANYAQVRTLHLSQGKIVGAAVYDRLGGKTLEIRASAVVNASGPWGDRVRSLDPTEKRRPLRLTKGIHLAFSKARLPLPFALTFASPTDGRPLFAIPWDKLTYVGTTDTDYEGDLEEPEIATSDVDYLLKALSYALPGANLGLGDIVGAWAGVRALVDERRDRPPWRVSREDRIEVSPAGLISVAGGKLTTYRAVAQRVVDLVQARLTSPRMTTPCRTADLPLGVGRTSEAVPTDLPLSPDVEQRLLAVYGAEAAMVVRHARAPEDLEPLRSDLPICHAEVLYWAHEEMAVTLADALDRRAGLLVFDPFTYAREALKIAAWMGEALGWDDQRITAEVTAYQELIQRRLNFRAPST